MITKYLHYILPFAFSALVCIAHFNDWLQSLNLLIYDNALKNYTTNQPEDIILVAIDEQSLKELGRWPWPRNLHAQLVNTLSESEVKSIVFDVIFAEENSANPEGDKEFIEAVGNCGRVIFPIHFEELRNKGQIVEVLPFKELFAKSASVGHVHINCDFDGVCRSVYLKEGIGSAYWPHLALALLNINTNNSFNKEAQQGNITDKNKHLSSMLIFREKNKLIPFSSNHQRLQTVSYVDVIEHRIPATLLKNKTVFIGATSAGMNDTLATPVGPMSGVEINALIYDSLRNNQLIVPANKLYSALLFSLFVFFVLYLFTSLSPFKFLLGSIISCFSIIAFSHVSLFLFKLWHPPAPAILAIASFYPLWSWFRLELALQFLNRSLENIQLNTPLLTNLSSVNSENSSTETQIWNKKNSQLLLNSRYQSDIISKTINQIFEANRIAHNNRQLVIQSLSQLQEAVFVFDSNGKILLKNSLADKFVPGFSNKNHDSHKANALVDLENQIEIKTDLNWQEGIKNLHEKKEKLSLEAQTRGLAEVKDLFIQGQYLDFSMYSAETSNPTETTSPNYLIFTITDVSSLKDAERSRMETLNFISHDLRSPMVSILALIENHRHSNRELTHDNQHFLSNIEQYVKINLNYAESLLQLGRAENTTVADFQLCDIHAILDSAVFQTQIQAEAKNITLATEREDSDIWVWGSGDLLERAFINLLTNATKYSPEQSKISIHLSIQKHKVILRVEDQGFGISSDDQEILFQRFKRGQKNWGQSGAGLGLYFVKTVANKHQGSIQIVETGPKGSIFELSLPLYKIDLH